jgi:predicted metal-dependent HD superfamily phosphohydrolase
MSFYNIRHEMLQDVNRKQVKTNYLMNFSGAQEYIIRRLKKELPATMIYHTLEHTLDVWKVAKQLMKKEKIDQRTGLIIETAALFHDAGMMITYKEHELASVEIARNSLPSLSYSTKEIAEICDLIMVTRLPQRPVTHSGYIICDADMDNLGRDDFLEKSFALKLEMEMTGIETPAIETWLANLVKFLEEHVYYTATAIKWRQAKKMHNLAELKEIVMRF